MADVFRIYSVAWNTPCPEAVFWKHPFTPEAGVTMQRQQRESSSGTEVAVKSFRSPQGYIFSPNSLPPGACKLYTSWIHQPCKYHIICQHTNTQRSKLSAKKFFLHWELTLETCESPVRNARQSPTLPSHCSREGTDSKLKSFHNNWPLQDRSSLEMIQLCLP